MDKLLERFLNYVSLDTQSKAGVRQVPSTEGQWKLLHLLKEQLEEMGLINVTLSEKGTLMATLPANVPGDIPAIGFISHVDTSPDCSGKNVNPQIVENYRGGDIALGVGQLLADIGVSLGTGGTLDGVHRVPLIFGCDLTAIGADNTGKTPRHCTLTSKSPDCSSAAARMGS